MSRRTNILRNGLIALATMSVLGFGAAQALAAPAGPAGVRACGPFPSPNCNTWCQERGYSRGVCTPGNNCKCYHD